VLTTLRDWGVWGGLATAAVLAIGAFLVGELVLLVLRRLGRRSEVLAGFARRARVPLLVVLVTGGLQSVVGTYADPEGTWGEPLTTVLRLAMTAGAFWLVGTLAFAFEDIVLKRFDVSATDNRKARRARTQIILVRRLTTGALVVVGLAVALMQFDGARTAGTSLLASAGVLSVVAGLAAQSSLANVFAGLQMAFTDALRVDDVVVVDKEWAKVEEITLTYTVLRIWDLRTLVVPNTHFTTTNFQNWTRTSAKVLGSVELDLDWNTPIRELREEFQSMVAASDLWDGDVSVLQTTEATGGWVRLRVLVSAVDGPTLFDLRCAVREHLVTWLRDNHPEALPRLRTNTGVEVERTTDLRGPSEDHSSSRMFSGSPEAENRASELTGALTRIEVGTDGKAVLPEQDRKG
jgi:small-conductance mechanosensitive channel